MTCLCNVSAQKLFGSSFPNISSSKDRCNMSEKGRQSWCSPFWPSHVMGMPGWCVAKEALPLLSTFVLSVCICTCCFDCPEELWALFLQAFVSCFEGEGSINPKGHCPKSYQWFAPVSWLHKLVSPPVCVQGPASESCVRWWQGSRALFHMAPYFLVPRGTNRWNRLQRACALPYDWLATHMSTLFVYVNVPENLALLQARCNKIGNYGALFSSNDFWGHCHFCKILCDLAQNAVGHILW